MDLSIIIPTYRPGQYIKDALGSIDKQLIQQYRIEIIVVLNGEKDPFFHFLNNLVLSYPLKVLYTKDKGVSNARNLGIEKAKGKYVLFLDDDDLLSENYVNTLLSYAFEENTVYVSNVLCFKDGEKEFYKDYIGRFISKKIDANNKQGLFLMTSYAKLMSSSCFKLIPKKVIGDKRFNTNLSISEDGLFMFEISKNIRNIEICESAFYYRRVRRESAQKTKKTKLVHIENYLKFISLLTVVYVKNFFTMDVLFYFNRVMASTKFMLSNISK